MNINYVLVWINQNLRYGHFGFLSIDCYDYIHYICVLYWWPVTSPMNLKCTSNTQIIKSIFFLEIFTNTNDDQYQFEVVLPSCSGAKWWTDVEVRGYVVIMLLSLFIANYKYKRYLMWTFYIISCILTLNVLYQHDIWWPISLPALEGMDPE